MSRARSFRGVTVRGLIDRKIAGDGRSSADGRIDAHPASVQFDERFYQRQAEAGASVARAVGMTLEPVEHLVLDVGWNARTEIGHGKHHMMLGTSGAQCNGGILGRETDR